MGLDSPSNFRDVDTTVNIVSYSSTRDNGKLIVRSGRKAMGPNSNMRLGSQVTERECQTAHLLVLEHSAIGSSDSAREVMA